METIKDILNFYNAAVFYDYKNVGITCELNQIRKCIINSFCKTIRYSRLLVCLCLVEKKVLKNHDNDIENFIENFHDLRENVLHMISFEKLIRDEQ